MNPKQELFATEYVVDHNATRAAVRAGYSEGTAKQSGYRLLQRPDVGQLVAKLDGDRRRALGVDADWIVDRLVAVHEAAFVDGSWPGAVRPLELLMRQLGIGSVETHAVEVSGEVVYTLTLDRELGEQVEE